MLSSAQQLFHLRSSASLVEVLVQVDLDEHARRRLHALGAVTSERLLDVLMSLPVGFGVPTDALADDDRRVVRRAAAGVVDEIGGEFFRQLARPLVIASVRATAPTWRSAQPVISRFAAHCERTVLLPIDELDAFVGAEAEHLGVGVETAIGEVLVTPRPFVQRRFTTFGWSFTESLYGQLLSSWR